MGYIAVWRGEPRTESRFFSRGWGVGFLCPSLIFWRFAMGHYRHRTFTRHRPMPMPSLCRLFAVTFAPFATKCAPIAPKTCLYRHKRDKKIAVNTSFVRFPSKFCSIKKPV